MRILRVLVLVIPVLNMQCAETPPSKLDVPPPPAPQTAQTARVDGAIEERIRALLALAGLEFVRPSVNEETGFVYLYGSVPDKETRDRLLATVGALSGVTNVQEGLLIHPPRPLSSPSDSAPSGFLNRLFAPGILWLAALAVGLALWVRWRNTRKPRLKIVRPPVRLVRTPAP